MKFSNKNKTFTSTLLLSYLFLTSCQNHKELIEVQIPVKSTFIKESQFPDPSLVKTIHGPFEMEGLSFKYDAIPSFITPSNAELHYSKHHLDYANALNKSIDQLGIQQHNIETILKSAETSNSNLISHAGGFYNHNLYWKSISHKSNTVPSAILTDRLIKDFGSLDDFKNKFKKASNDLIGSGWIWLIYNEGILIIVATQNNDTPFNNSLYKSGLPLLALDLWEHAYYPTYQNNRDQYINEFINHIDWDFVSSKLETHTE